MAAFFFRDLLAPGTLSFVAAAASSHSIEVTAAPAHSRILRPLIDIRGIIASVVLGVSSLLVVVWCTTLVALALYAIGARTP